MSLHETIPSDEAARFEKYGSELTALQRQRAQKSGTVSRTLHVQQHIGAVGELVIGAAEGARAGVFATDGGRVPVYARFSNGGSVHQSDKAPKSVISL